MTRLTTLLLPTAILLSTSALARADVLTVGGLNPAYTDLPAAVAAAVDGDVLLVRAGWYSGFTVDGKELAVVVDTGAWIQVTTTVTVRNLPAGKTVVLAGLTIQDTYEARSLELQNNAGRVRIQSLAANTVGSPFGSTYEAVRVLQCADVSFAGCAIQGAHGTSVLYDFGSQSTSGLETAGSNVTLVDCTVRGGRGRPGWLDGAGIPHNAGHGAAAVVHYGGALFARGSTIRGGDGGRGLDGTANPPNCTNPVFLPTAGGNGGPGINIMTSSAFADLVATTLEGGAGGAGGLSSCVILPPGADGPPVAGPPGYVHTLPGPALRFVPPQPAREGGQLALHFEGAPGSRVILLQGHGGAGYMPVPTLKGILLVAPPLRRLDLGTIPVSGALDVNLPVPPDLGVGVEARLEHVQAVIIDTAGRSHLAAPAVVVMLDAAF